MLISYPVFQIGTRNEDVNQVVDQDGVLTLKPQMAPPSATISSSAPDVLALEPVSGKAADADGRMALPHMTC